MHYCTISITIIREEGNDTSTGERQRRLEFTKETVLRVRAKCVTLTLSLTLRAEEVRTD